MDANKEIFMAIMRIAEQVKKENKPIAVYDIILGEDLCRAITAKGLDVTCREYKNLFITTISPK